MRHWLKLDLNSCKIMTKTCCKCKQEKPETEFYPRSDRPGKRVSQCRTCRQLIYKQRMSIRVNYNRKIQYRREWRKTESGRLSQQKETQRAKALYPEKVRARKAINHMVEKGELAKISTRECIHCGNQAEQYHHYIGYEEQYHRLVQPVCLPCHSILHTGMHLNYRS